MHTLKQLLLRSLSFRFLNVKSGRLCRLQTTPFDGWKSSRTAEESPQDPREEGAIQRAQQDHEFLPLPWRTPRDCSQCGLELRGGSHKSRRCCWVCQYFVDSASGGIVPGANKSSDGVSQATRFSFQLVGSYTIVSSKLCSTFCLRHALRKSWPKAGARRAALLRQIRQCHPRPRISRTSR